MRESCALTWSRSAAAPSALRSPAALPRSSPRTPRPRVRSSLTRTAIRTSSTAARSPTASRPRPRRSRAASRRATPRITLTAVRRSLAHSVEVALTKAASPCRCRVPRRVLGCQHARRGLDCTRCRLVRPHLHRQPAAVLRWCRWPRQRFLRALHAQGGAERDLVGSVFGELKHLDPRQHNAGCDHDDEG